MVIYVEGGGKSKALRSECRRGFSEFLRKAGFAGKMPRITACGGRQDAFNSFCTAIENSTPGDYCILLIDSEGPVTVLSPWLHLAQRQGDNWTRPHQATDDHCHLMVQCMETWFLADKQAMLAFFGQGYNENALPNTTNIESIAKNTLYDSIENATRNCKTKGAYDKSDHSFRLLAKIDPARVRNASPWARRFLDTLSHIAG
jgi:hypothetical protein